ncbi:MAG: HDOD domain-containing protein [Zoogloeaceae bacterium]|jgi:putative nucleotidyltransferase with HDIG domain|nr:HDOD domain-containing protein [Zoogloeaceae bacterium]
MTGEKPPLLSEARLREAIAALPGLPPLISGLLADLSHADDGLNFSVLAQRIAADQGLALRILRLANSSFYGLSGQVASIDDAIVILGLRSLHAMILNIAALRVITRPPCAGFAALEFWRHSIAVAVAARALAVVCRKNPDIAFTQGLLHDIGQLLLASCFPDEYRQALDDPSSERAVMRLDSERALLGVEHAQAGAMLAAQWGLPPELVAAIAQHHAPDSEAADLLHLADILAHALMDDDDAPIPRLSAPAWQRLALDETRLLPVLARIEHDFEETCKALLS